MSPPGNESSAQHEERLAEESELETIDLDALPARPAASRKHLFQIAVAVAVIAATLIGFWRALPPPPPAPQVVRATPTAVPNQDALIESNVSYGTVTLNGKTLAGAPPLLGTLSRGMNQIILEAPPFRKVSCQIAWPPTFRQDTCSGPYGYSAFNLGATRTSLTFKGKTITPAAIIALPLSADDLPADLHSAAVSAITAALNTTDASLRTVVPAGQHYATGIDQQGFPISSLAATRLMATPLVALHASGYGFHACVAIICPLLDDFGTASPVSHQGKQWLIASLVAPGWRFTTAAGDPVAEVTFPAQQTESQTVLLALSYTGMGGWSVAQQELAYNVVQGFCEAGREVLVSIQHSSQPTEPDIEAGASAEGCKYQLEVPNTSPATAATPTPFVPAQFLWRFGVLLAADANAHTFLPDLPVASQAELAAVGG
jgi:hypothetical protein